MIRDLQKDAAAEENQEAVEAEQESTEDVKGDLGLDTEAGEEEVDVGDEETSRNVDMLW